jgi:hypothetical protein
LRHLVDAPNAWRRRTAACVGLAGSVTLSHAHAHAQSRLELDWDAPAECPQGPAVRQKLDALLGDAAAKMGRLRADGRIERAAGRYRLTLTVHDGSHARDRTIEAEACSDLAGAAAVALGLLLRGDASSKGAAVSTSPDDGARGAETVPGSAPASSESPTAARSAATTAATPNAPVPAKAPTTPSAAASSASPSETASGRSLPRRWNVMVRAPMVHAEFGRLPKPGLGLGAGLGFRYDAWRVGLSGRIFFDQTLWSNLASPDAGADVTRAVVEAWACRGFRAGAFEVSPCLSVGLDHLATDGVGTDVQSQSATANSAIFGAAAVAHYRVAPWLAVVAMAGLGAETSRPRLTITSLGEVQRLGPVVFSLGLGPEWIF